MKNPTLVFTILLLAGVERCHSQNTWTQKADFGWNTASVPPSRYGAVSFSIGNFGYVGTGNGLKDFWQYDPTNNSWTQKADYGGGGRSFATGFSIDSLGYIGTGEDDSSNQTADFWEYNPNNNTWAQKADFGGGARQGSTGLNIGSKGYIGLGGSDEYWVYGATIFNDFWEYDPTSDTWTQKADFGGGLRIHAVGFSIGSNGYIGTGLNDSAWWDQGFKDFWEYNPNDDTWTQKADFGGDALYSAAGFSINNLGYIGTGMKWDGEDDTRQFWEYNPDSDEWTQKSDFGGSARYYAPAFSIGNKGYIGMGDVHSDNYDSYYATDFWEYDPAEDLWTQKGDLKGSVQYGSAGFSINGKGYMGTGVRLDPDYNYLYLKDFWEYDPDADTWTQKADFGGGYRVWATGFSIGNNGYLGTGINGSFPYSYTNDFWEYDPDANSWTQKADFGGVARTDAVGFSIGSKGYLGTGRDQFGTEHKDFWEYNPDADNWTQKADVGWATRNGAVGFSIGSKGYIGTGYGDGENKNDFWEYDPDANNWAQKADFGGTPRAGAVGFSISSKGYLGTGYDGIYPNYYKKDFWEYNPDTDSWTQKADFGGLSRSDACGFSIGNKGYIGTGGYFFPDYNDFWEYIPDLDNGVPSVYEDACVLSVFPNPANGAFITYLNLGNEENYKGTAEVLNLLGQKVYSQNAQVVNGVLQKEIQFDNSADGMYLVKVSINDQVYSAQLNYQK